MDNAEAYGINASGDTVGAYHAGSSFTGAFLFDAAGSFALFSYAGGSEAFGINNSGWVVGAYFKGVTTHGFLRDPRGAFVTVDFPEVSATVPFAINANGDIVGWYFDNSNEVYAHGFVIDNNGGFTSIDFPDADYSQIYAVDDDGNVFGTYFNQGLHGFVARPVVEGFHPIDTTGIAPGLQGFEAAATPEPASIMLLATAVIIALVVFRLRFRNRQRSLLNLLAVEEQKWINKKW